MHFSQAAAVERAQALSSAQGRHPRATGCDRRGDRRVPVLGGVRCDPVAPGPRRNRGAPRRHAAEVPPARRDARPARAAAGDLRHRHARRRHQRADPHRAAHRAHQVRRHPDAAAERARVPPGRRSGRPRRIRHRRRGRRRGARARDRERPRRGEGRRRPEGAQEARQEAGARGIRQLGGGQLRAADRRRTRDAHQFDADHRGDADQRDRRGDAAATAFADRARAGVRQPRAVGRGNCELARRALGIYRTLRDAGVVERRSTARASGSPSTCSRTSRSTSRCRRSRSPRSSCWIRPNPRYFARHDLASSSRPSTTRARCSASSSTSPAARRSRR